MLKVVCQDDAGNQWLFEIIAGGIIGGYPCGTSDFGWLCLALFSPEVQDLCVNSGADVCVCVVCKVARGQHEIMG